MVVFTCSYCGEPVKKPAVSKHYDTKCRRRNPNLTCVDCLKDFRGSEYEAHTKCISENERYGAKGSFTGNTVNKGEKKQQEWSEHIQNVLQTATLRVDEKEVIEIISKHENIPRQKKKFENFINSAYKSLRCKSDLINRVWEKIKPAENTNNNSNSSSNNQSAGKENSFKPEEKVLRSPESKKRKHDEAFSELVTENSNGVLDIPKAKKNKKSKKEKHQEVPEVQIIDEVEVINEVQIIEKDSKVNDVKPESSKKKDKKKKQKTVQENGEREIEEIVVENGADLGSIKKKNKKKSKNKSLENGEQEMSNDAAPANREASGKEKKKKLANGNVLESTQEIITVEENVDSKPQFSWSDTIKTVLGKKADKEKILLESLRKKVLKKYSKNTGNEAGQEQCSKFLKKLKKISNITVEDEYVILHKTES